MSLTENTKPQPLATSQQILNSKKNVGNGIYFNHYVTNNLKF